MTHIWTWTRNGTPVLTTPEGVDIANDRELREKLLSVSDWNPVVVVDGSTFRTFFSVGAMRVLDEASRRMAAVGGELRLATTRPNMRRDLGIARYGSLLQIFESLDDALDVTLQPQAA